MAGPEADGPGVQDGRETAKAFISAAASVQVCSRHSPVIGSSLALGVAVLFKAAHLQVPCVFYYCFDASVWPAAGSGATFKQVVCCGGQGCPLA